MRYLAVKNFEKFQHYRDRRPPWIKFYGAILDDYAFVQLSDASRSHLMLIWQVAATHDNRIPFDPKYIAQAIKSRSRVNLKELIEAGFLQEIDESAVYPLADHAKPASTSASKAASTLLAEPEHDASKNGARFPARAHPRARGEAEGEAETERETETDTSAATREAAIAQQLTSDAGRNALTSILRRAASPITWIAEIDAALTGMHGTTLTPAQLDEALRDYVGNGAFERGNLRSFRNYLRVAKEPPPEMPAATRRREESVSFTDVAKRMASRGGGHG